MNIFKFLCGLFFIVCVVTITKAWMPPKLVGINQWGLNPIPKFKHIKMPLIPQYVVITDTKTQTCYDYKYCSIFLNYIINYESLRTPSKSIPAHFYIGGDGHIYEGRGWNFVGGNNFGCEDNTSIIEICFIGNLKKSIFTPKQFQAAYKLIKFGIRSGKLSKSYKLFDGRKLSDKKVMSEENNSKMIETWPYWTKNETICSDGFSNYIPIVY